MIKWIDEVDSKIDAVNKRVDNIVAEEVDAKNLSEVLDNLTPITKTTDLSNNKVKLGIDMDTAVTVANPITKNINSSTGACELAMNIDNDTLEVTEGGALKVKSAGGSKKYLHHITLKNSSHDMWIYFDIITNDSTPYGTGSLYSHTDLNNVLLALPTATFDAGGITYDAITPCNSNYILFNNAIRQYQYLMKSSNTLFLFMTIMTISDGVFSVSHDNVAFNPTDLRVYDNVVEL